MLTKIYWNDECQEITTQDNESEFYEKVAYKISQAPIPSTVRIVTESGEDAEYEITARSGTMFVKELSNSIVLNKSNYKPVYLVCVNAEKNNYKYYQLEQAGDEVIATYGRIGAKEGEMYGTKTYSYPTRMFWIKFYEKKTKGYEDKTSIYLNIGSSKKEKEKNQAKEEPVANSSVSFELYSKLRRFAKLTVEENCIDSNVTQVMVKESKRLLNLLYKRKTVKGFNKKLLELLAISPRKVHQVSLLLAKSVSDFADIIYREENLISAMEALVPETVHHSIRGFNGMEIEVFLANDKQKSQVLAKLDQSLVSKVKTIYRVIHKSHKKRFDDYLSKNNISKVKQLWHGSRNENWFSILSNGLLLNPNAVITGKMFGNGIYFAPSCVKSWNYTSYRNSYWAKGSSDTAFMGLYATAYGTPLDVYSAHSYSKNTISGRNCVHAHAGSALRNDEIIFYDDSAMILNYIVEFN